MYNSRMSIVHKRLKICVGKSLRVTFAISNMDLSKQPDRSSAALMRSGWLVATLDTSRCTDLSLAPIYSFDDSRPSILTKSSRLLWKRQMRLNKGAYLVGHSTVSRKIRFAFSSPAKVLWRKTHIQGSKSKIHSQYMSTRRPTLKAAHLQRIQVETSWGLVKSSIDGVTPMYCGHATQMLCSQSAV